MRGHGRSDRPGGSLRRAALRPRRRRPVRAHGHPARARDRTVAGRDDRVRAGPRAPRPRAQSRHRQQRAGHGAAHVPRCRRAGAPRDASRRFLGPSGMARTLAPLLFPKPEQADLRERFRQSMAANDPIAYRRSTMGLMGWSVAHRLHEITCPVLVVASERDYTSVAFKQAYIAPHARRSTASSCATRATWPASISRFAWPRSRSTSSPRWRARRPAARRAAPADQGSGTAKMSWPDDQ